MKKFSLRVEWDRAPDIQKRIGKLIKVTEIDWVKRSRVFTFRSRFSKTRAYARTWGLPSLWQRALKIPPAYIIEVISEHFDKLSEKDRDKVILHELSHIPKNFSGALLPHTRRRKGSFHRKLEVLIDKYLRNIDNLL